jgi:hypothetical protein
MGAGTQPAELPSAAGRLVAFPLWCLDELTAADPTTDGPQKR